MQRVQTDDIHLPQTAGWSSSCAVRSSKFHVAPMKSPVTTTSRSSRFRFSSQGKVEGAVECLDDLSAPLRPPDGVQVVELHCIQEVWEETPAARQDPVFPLKVTANGRLRADVLAHILADRDKIRHKVPMAPW